MKEEGEDDFFVCLFRIDRTAHATVSQSTTTKLIRNCPRTASPGNFKAEADFDMEQAELLLLFRADAIKGIN